MSTVYLVISISNSLLHHLRHFSEENSLKAHVLDLPSRSGNRPIWSIMYQKLVMPGGDVFNMLAVRCQSPKSFFLFIACVHSMKRLVRFQTHFDGGGGKAQWVFCSRYTL